MSFRLILSSAVVASFAAIVPTEAGGPSPAGASSKVVAEIGKHPRQPASGMDARGGWYLADGPHADESRTGKGGAPIWFAEDMASMSVEDRRSLCEKRGKILPIPEDGGKSLVIRHIGGGGDKPGVSSVFADGFDGLLDSPEGGMLLHDGVLYFASVPKVMMLRDSDGDGRAEQRKVVQDGFGVRISLPGHGFGGLTLGPDGRVYGTIGDKGMNFTTREGNVCRFPNQGAAFRFELDGSGFECFHTGLRNPGNVTFDELGNAFTVDENPGTAESSRVIYLVEGGDSGWEMEHEAMVSFPEWIGPRRNPPNRWNDGLMAGTRVSGQPAFLLPSAGVLDVRPAGFDHHPGTGYLESGAGRFFLGGLRSAHGESAVWSFNMKPDGAGMTMSGERRELPEISASNLGFTPDGRLWVADSAAGRLLTVDAGASTWLPQESSSTSKLLRDGFHQRSSAELANLLRHPDSRVRLSAQLALTRKADALERFTEATLSSNTLVRVHGIRGLGIIARCGPIPEAFNDFGTLPSGKSVAGALSALASLTSDRDEEIRCQSLRALADARDDAPDLNLGLLLDDESTRVRFFAAIVAGKRRMAGYFGPVCEMLDANAGKDPWLRHAGAYALQRMAPDPSLLRALADHESPAVRIAAVAGLRRMASPEVEAFLGDSDPAVAAEAVRTVCDLDLAEARPAVAVLLDDGKAAGFPSFMLRCMMHNSFRLGDGENAARVLKLAMDENLSAPLREEAFFLLGSWCRPPEFDQLTGRWSPLEPRDPSTIAPLLRKSLPAIAPRDAAGIAAARELAKAFQLDPAIVPAPLDPVAPAAPPAAGPGEPPAQRLPGNPWLYIVIGLLLVTGILLYIDPRIF